MKKVLIAFVLVLLTAGLWGQSNELLDRFLDADTADVATTLMLVGQAAGELPMDAVPDDGYAWAEGRREFGKHVAKTSPDDPVSLGLFYLALLQSFDVKGGLMYSAVGSPRYAALEAGYLGYVEPSGLYPTRSMAPYEVLTGIGYVLEKFEGGNQ